MSLKILNKNSSSYAVLLIVIIILISAPIWISTVLFWRGGEIWPLSKVVSYQKDNFAIMNMGILSNEREYKHELFLKSKPDIMAIGSSRILQIRQDMFDRSFINMGRGLDMSNLRNDLPSLLDHHQPKFILFGFDYWLFSKERVDGEQSGKQKKA